MLDGTLDVNIIDDPGPKFGPLIIGDKVVALVEMIPEYCKTGIFDVVGMMTYGAVAGKCLYPKTGQLVDCYAWTWVLSRRLPVDDPHIVRLQSLVGSLGHRDWPDLTEAETKRWDCRIKENIRLDIDKAIGNLEKRLAALTRNQERAAEQQQREEQERLAREQRLAHEEPARRRYEASDPDTIDIDTPDAAAFQAEVDECNAELARENQVRDRYPLPEGISADQDRTYSIIDNDAADMECLSALATALYYYLHRHCIWPKAICWPGLRKMADRFHTNQNQILKALHELVKARLITIEKGVGKRCNQYRITLRPYVVATVVRQTKAKIQRRREQAAENKRRGLQW